MELYPVVKNKCHQCNGTGVEKGEEVVEINIPAGVAEGMVVNVPGKGNLGYAPGEDWTSGIWWVFV